MEPLTQEEKQFILELMKQVQINITQANAVQVALLSRSVILKLSQPEPAEEADGQ